MNKSLLFLCFFGLIVVSSANAILGTSAEQQHRLSASSNANSEVIDEEIDELLSKLRVYLSQKEIDSLVPMDDFYESKRDILKRPFNPQTRWGKRASQRFNPQTR
jgi:hypothetical protein